MLQWLVNNPPKQLLTQSLPYARCCSRCLQEIETKSWLLPRRIYTLTSTHHQLPHKQAERTLWKTVCRALQSKQGLGMGPKGNLVKKEAYAMDSKLNTGLAGRDRWDEEGEVFQEENEHRQHNRESTGCVSKVGSGVWIIYRAHERESCKTKAKNLGWYLLGVWGGRGMGLYSGEKHRESIVNEWCKWG